MCGYYHIQRVEDESYWLVCGDAITSTDDVNPFDSARILVFLMFPNQSPLRAIVWSPHYTDPPSCIEKQATARNICCWTSCCVFFVVSNGQERYDTHSCAISFCGLPWRSTFPVFIFVKRTLALAGASETGHPKRGLCPARATT